jgi:ribonucleotide reductase alpha subunit
LALSPNAVRVLETRHLRRHAERRIAKTPEQLVARVAGAVAGAEALFDNAREIPRWRDEFRRMLTALETPPEQHLQIQGAFQRHTDSSVSKTINLPHTATRDDIAHAYIRAWELGLTGVTVYRYGSKASQVLELGTDESASRIDHASRCAPGECRL